MQIPQLYPSFTECRAQKNTESPAPPTLTPRDTHPSIVHFGTTKGHEDAMFLQKWV